MKKFSNTIFTDLNKALYSWNFLGAILGTLLVYAIIIKPEFNSSVDVLYLFRVSVEYIGVYHLMFILMCTIPYSTSFCTEFNSKNFKYSIIRSDATSYCWSKIIACSISGGLAIALGTFIFIFCTSFFIPLVNSNPEIYSLFAYTTGGQLLGQGKYIIYFSIYIILTFFKGVLWSAIGLAISAYIPNIFVALSAPFILSYIYRIFTASLHISFTVENICNGIIGNYVSNNTGLTLLFGIVKILSITFIVGYIFTKKVKWRLANE